MRNPTNIEEKASLGYPSMILPLSLIKKEMGMVRCLDCHNLLTSWIPATKPDMLFDQRWKCKITGQLFEMYYLLEKEWQCTHYNKPSLEVKTH